MSDNSLKILEVVSDYLIDNPDQRFCQSLYNLDIILGKDCYYDSDEEVIERTKIHTLTLGDIPY